MKLSENLYLYRKELGLSQEELAEKCQVSRQSIAKWESAESVPTLEKLLFLADLYEVTLDEMIGRADDLAILRSFIKRYIPSDLHFNSEDSDVLPVVCRFFAFLDQHGFSAEEKLHALEEVFLADIGQN